MILYLAIAAGPVVSGAPAILGQVHILRVVQLPVFTAQYRKYQTISSALFILIRYKKSGAVYYKNEICPLGS